ncbi:hypothetical protein L3X38_009500 [Prunus dulcis]|uniref:Uncharacterized protein n=1 Tax=Prunus dulcis TaxID=3755 RepID=A0AAD4WDS3_PRUDU|nr:hypothetical protein L3X38_009500 [Prunus dulcis]
MMKSRLPKTKAFSLLPKSSIHNTDYLRRSHRSPAFINILPRHHVHKQNYSLVIRANSSKFRPSSEATLTTENEAVTDGFPSLVEERKRRKINIKIK